MDAAIVALHGQRIGRLDRLTPHFDFRFRFDPAWLADPDRPVLGQLFTDRMPRDIITSGFPCWFAHLLPQGPARRLIQRWAGLDLDEDDDFDLLMAIGHDLPGAVTLHPATRPMLREGSYAIAPPLVPDAPGFSLPGAQYKLSVAPGERGLVIATRDTQGAYIAKFHDPSFPGLQVLEYATTRWAALAGIRCHEARLATIDEFAQLPDGLPTGDGRVFLATRFDRSKQGAEHGAEQHAIHAEDFGQILDIPPGERQYKATYEMIGQAIALICPDDAPEYIERLAFMLVSGNTDAHLKNWGVIYPDRRNPRLGPAYDLVAVVARLRNDTLALSLGGESAFPAMTLRHIAGLAPAVNLTESEVRRLACATRDRALAAWHDHHRALPFTESERALIEKHFARTPFCSDR